MIAIDTTLSRARAAVQNEDYKSARRLLMTLLPSALAPKHRVERTTLLAQCLQATGGARLALELLDDELSQAPNELYLLKTAAEIYNVQGYYQQAEDALRRAMLVSSNAQTICTLASFLHEQSRLEEALSLYINVLRKNPGHYEASFGRARLLDALGKTQESQRAWERFTHRYPDDFDGWIFLGIAQSNLGKFSSALLAFEKAAAIDPFNISAHYNRAVVESRLNQLDNIEFCADLITSIDQEDPRAFLVRSWAAGSDRRSARKFAIAAAQAAINSDLDEDDIDIFLASALSRLEELLLPDDFQRIFRDALVKEQVGFETLVVYREYEKNLVKTPRCFRILLEFLPSAHIKNLLLLSPKERVIRRLDVISSSERRARRIACEMERLSGARSPRVLKVFSIDLAQGSEAEGVLFRSPAAPLNEWL